MTRLQKLTHRRRAAKTARPWIALVARRFVFARPLGGPNPPAVMIADDDQDGGTRVLLKFADLEQALCFGMALTAEARARLAERDQL